jgi:hypothetical protein
MTNRRKTKEPVMPEDDVNRTTKEPAEAGPDSEPGNGGRSPRGRGAAAVAATPPSKGSGVSTATEKPVSVGPPPRTSQYLVTVDNRTGVAIKIEKLDGETGDRKELTAAEYAVLYPQGGPQRPPAAAASTPAAIVQSAPAARMSPSLSSASVTALTEAYYRGVADYITSLTPTK